MVTKVITVSEIVDQKHLDAIVDAINEIAYVSDIANPS